MQLITLTLGNLFQWGMKFCLELCPYLHSCCESHRTANSQTVCLLGDFDAAPMDEPSKIHYEVSSGPNRSIAVVVKTPFVREDCNSQSHPVAQEERPRSRTWRRGGNFNTLSWRLPIFELISCLSHYKKCLWSFESYVFLGRLAYALTTQEWT